MNILICVTSLNYAMGGVSSHILDLCRYYNDCDEVKKVIVCCDGGEHIPSLSSLPKVTYIYIPFWETGIKKVFSQYKTLLGIVKKEKIDIIHSHSQRILPILHFIKLFTGTPYLWTNHIDAIPQEKVFKAMCRIMRFPLISVSHQLRDMMIEKYKCNPEKCFVVNNGININDFKPLDDAEKNFLYKKYKINKKERPYVISQLSRLTPIKGQRQLLEAIAKIPEKDKIHVLLAGDISSETEEYAQSLVAFAAQNSISLELLGFSKPREIFGVSDLFVLPSIFEGFAIVCIEAVMMDCAVIRTCTPGWQEMEDWLDVVDINDSLQLQNAISSAINNDFNKEKIVKGKCDVLKNFTKESCGCKTLAVYKKILK